MFWRLWFSDSDSQMFHISVSQLSPPQPALESGVKAAKITARSPFSLDDWQDMDSPLLFLTDGCFLGRDKKRLHCSTEQFVYWFCSHQKQSTAAIAYHERDVEAPGYTSVVLQELSEPGWKWGNGHVWFLERERFHQISGRGRREAMNTEHIHGVLITIP